MKLKQDQMWIALYKIIIKRILEIFANWMQIHKNKDFWQIQDSRLISRGTFYTYQNIHIVEKNSRHLNFFSQRSTYFQIIYKDKYC